MAVVIQSRAVYRDEDIDIRSFPFYSKEASSSPPPNPETKQVPGTSTQKSQQASNNTAPISNDLPPEALSLNQYLTSASLSAR
jgi:hypothetical protein